MRPRQNGCHFADDIFRCIEMNENVWIPIKISLKFVPKGPINNIPAVVQIMACRLDGAKPLCEPMMVTLPTHICVTRPQWVKLGFGYLGQVHFWSGKPKIFGLTGGDGWNFAENFESDTGNSQRMKILMKMYLFSVILNNLFLLIVIFTGIFFCYDPTTEWTILPKWTALWFFYAWKTDKEIFLFEYY